MALVDPRTLKLYLNLDVADTSQDEFISILLAWSDAQIVNMCGQQIALTQPEPLIFDGNGRTEYVIPNHPVQSIVSLKTRTQPQTTTWDKVYTAFGATAGDYELNKKKNAIFFPQGFGQGRDQYQVVYTYGYADIPADVQSVALEMAAIAYRESSIKGNQDPRLGVQSVSVGVSGLTGTKSHLDMVPTWSASLSSYKYLGTF